MKDAKAEPSIVSGPLDYKGAAAALGCSVRTVCRLVRQKRLVAMRIGHRTVRFRPVDIERCMATMAGESKREW